VLSVKGGSWISFSLPKNDKRKLIEAMKAAEGRMGEINPLCFGQRGPSNAVPKMSSKCHFDPLTVEKIRAEYGNRLMVLFCDVEQMKVRCREDTNERSG
jgi:hypothetical protein